MAKVYPDELEAASNAVFLDMEGGQLDSRRLARAALEAAMPRVERRVLRFARYELLRTKMGDNSQDAWTSGMRKAVRVLQDQIDRVVS
jgi:hypothetical protein